MLAALAVVAAMEATAAGTNWTLEHLGQPARSRNILAGRVVVDRNTAKEMLVLANNNEGSGMELIFVDFREGTGKVIRAPAGAGAWALTEIPGDRLVVGTFYDGTLMLFDLKKMEFIKSVQFPGETYIWQLAMGSDGRLYGGTFPGGKLGALDLSTYALEDLGAPAAPNYYLRNVSATPDGRILCYFMVQKPTLLVFDPASKKFDPVPEQLQGIRSAAVWKDYLVAGNRFFQGRDFRAVEAPFPVPPPENGEWEIETSLTTTNILYVRQGHLLWRYGEDERLSLVTSADLRGGRFLAVARDGRILGIRGQDYFTIKPGDTQLDLRRIPGYAAPRTIQFLRADPRGRIWGGPPFGQTLFWLDPKTKKAVNTQTISDTGGEVYDLAFVNGVTYAAAYSGGEVIRYDPRKPWDQLNQKNPKTLTTIRAKGYIRPTGGIIVGPSQKLYSGWTAALGTYGGAVAITDPKNGTTELLENPLGEQQITGLATDGKLVYVGSGLAAGGLPTKTGESPKLGIIDPTTKKVVWEQTMSGATRVRPLGYDRKTQIVPVVVESEIRLFKVPERTFVNLRETPPPVESWAVALPGDGTLYYGSGKKVVLMDMISGTSKTITEASGSVNNVTLAPDGTLYVGVGVDLYALRSRDLAR